MTHAAPLGFQDRFRALTGHDPMGWQQRLYDDWLGRARVPRVLDLPTGLGKTSAMAVWLIARAAGANLPRRLVYVVDRRAVVDQATEEALKLRDKAKDALQIEDLAISTLRGRFADNRRWQEDPAAPAIVVGTIDMIGSRLLFEGYGVSRKMRPYHAGFLGADALVVLDEAHLCPPFEALLEAIRDQPDLQPLGTDRQAIVPRFKVMALSATGRQPRDIDESEIFRLTESDRQEPLVAQRIEAAKRLAIHDLPAGAKLDEVLAESAWALGEGGGRVLVFCHSRDTARKVAGALKGPQKEKRRLDQELMVGKRRVKERETLARRLKALGFLPPEPGEEPPARERPAFLVATSAGEVGIDLDADHLVCDLVACERMIQRLGRVNRRGGRGRTALVEVIAAPDPKAAPEETERFARMRAAIEALPYDMEDGRRNASPAAFAQLKHDRGDLVAAATTPEPLRPALDRAVVDAWSLTSLDRHTGRPDPEPWLRGWIEDDQPETTLVWRRWLPWRAGEKEPRKDEVKAFFDAARPHASELLDVPGSEAVETLIARARALRDLRAEAGEKGKAPCKTGIILLDRARDLRVALTVDQLAEIAAKKGRDWLCDRLVGATAVVSAELGGLDGDGLLDPGAAEPPPCLDDGGGYGETGWSEEDLKAIGFRVRRPGDDAELPKGWRPDHTFPLALGDEEEPQRLAVAVWRGKTGNRTGDPAVAREPQSLDDHCRAVERAAREIALELGLDPAYRDMLAAAARLHDRGKDRDLWQNAMGAPRAGRPYAKTKGAGDPNRLKIGEHTYRHEFGSLRDAENDDGLRALPADLQDLALHLIAAHHGYARPEIAPVDPASPTSRNEARARTVALRFARLQRLWGPWGLAWWESVLRAADHRASRLNDDKTGADDPAGTEGRAA